MRSLLLAAVAAVVLVCSVAGAASAKPRAARSSEQTLQQDVAALHDAGAAGALAQTVSNGDSETARAGVKRLGEDDPVPWNAHYRTGSVTKTFVAATILKLEAQGKLSLDDTVEHWLPGVIHGNGNDGSQITVRELLNHTSGLFEFTNDPAFYNTLLTPEEFIANRYRHWSPRELIDIAIQNPPDFAPGTSWSYSNTNYVVAGEIIKAATGHTWDYELKKLILDPLRLRDTSVPGDDPILPEPFASGYEIFTSDPAQRVYTDATEHNMTSAGASGAMTTTTRDVNRFMSELMKGHVLAPAQLAEMKTEVPLGPGVGYGLGIAHLPLSCTDTGYWTHDGAVFGYISDAAVTPDGSRSVALVATTHTFMDDAYFNGVYDGIAALEDHFFCPSGRRAARARAASIGQRRAVARLRIGMGRTLRPTPRSVGSSQQTLQQDVDALHDGGATGVLAHTVTNGYSTRARAGVRELGDDDPVPFGAHYRTGSVTKTFVAATVLKLVGQGKLSLDDTVEHWVPGLIDGDGYDGSQITVRMLLNHTSGLPDYTNEPDFFNTIITPDAFQANRFRHWSPRELIGIALANPPLFPPGTDWSYSSTNYVAAGQIIEAVTGHSWRYELKKLILDPLGLSDTTAPGDDPTLPEPFAHSYEIFTEDPAAREYTDTTEDNLSWGDAAGELITTTADVNRFFSKLMKGQVLAPAQLAAMKDYVVLAPGIGYGLGIEHFPLSCDNAGFWTHDGGVVGGWTQAGASDDGSRTFAVNVFTNTFSDADFADATGNGISALEDHFFCPTAARSPALSAAQTRAIVRLQTAR